MLFLFLDKCRQEVQTDRLFHFQFFISILCHRQMDFQLYVFTFRYVFASSSRRTCFDRRFEIRLKVPNLRRRPTFVLNGRIQLFLQFCILRHQISKQFTNFFVDMRRTDGDSILSSTCVGRIFMRRFAGGVEQSISLR